MSLKLTPPPSMGTPLDCVLGFYTMWSNVVCVQVPALIPTGHLQMEVSRFSGASEQTHKHVSKPVVMSFH